mmetsp:Transcript_66307/g.205305  ORF Transcript_66307/g.205305 Transcript_66307/m.205305 type:complete len:195 (-) Transcript_66307:60-644(-)
MDVDRFSPHRLEELRQRFQVHSREQFLVVRWYVPQLDLCNGMRHGTEEIHRLHAAASAMDIDTALDTADETARGQRIRIMTRLDELRSDMLGLRAIAFEARGRLHRVSLGHLFSASELGLTSDQLRGMLLELAELWSAELARAASWALAAVPALGQLTAVPLWRVAHCLPLRDLPALTVLGLPALLLKIPGEAC